jgi:hypothetical protein
MDIHSKKSNTLNYEIFMYGYTENKMHIVGISMYQSICINHPSTIQPHKCTITKYCFHFDVKMCPFSHINCLEPLIVHVLYALSITPHSRESHTSHYILMKILCK